MPRPAETYWTLRRGRAKMSGSTREQLVQALQRHITIAKKSGEEIVILIHPKEKP